MRTSKSDQATDLDETLCGSASQHTSKTVPAGRERMFDPRKRLRRDLRTSHLTRGCERIVRAAINETMRAGNTVSEPHGLYYICLDYLASPTGAQPLRLPSCAIDRRPFPIRPFPDQLSMVREALDRAREQTGCEDDSQALVQICLEFLDQEDFYDVGGPEWPVSARSGRPSGEEAEGSPSASALSLHIEASTPLGSGLLATRRRVDQCPTPAHRSGSNWRPPSRQGSTPHGHKRGDGATAISTEHCPPKAGMHGSGLALHLAGPYPSFPIRTVRALAAILQLTERQVRELAEEAGDLYVAGSVLKPDGGWRPIDEPNERLKKVQRALHESLLEPLISSPIGCGVRGRTQIDAARRHAKRPFVGSVDIENFFPSVTSDAVQTLFRQMDCPADLASLLAMLTTLRGSLPQGAPTSPTVAGILLAGVDRQVHEEAQRLGLGVTRYADDFAASGERSESIEALFSVIEEALGPLGLRVNPNKTDIAPRSETQVVLGLTVNNRVSVPKPYRKHLARAVFKASRDGCTERAFRRLRGQIAYVAQLHPKEARGLERALLSARCGR